MSVWIALLRAVNVGGTGKLPMEDLRRLAEEAGFKKARSYIASGNLIFETASGEAKVKAVLEQALQAYAGSRIGVIVRSPEELSQVLADNPFAEAPTNRTVAIFLDEPPPADAIEKAGGIDDERLALGRREIYVAYGDNMGRSKLRIPAGKNGTARNMNTIAKLLELASG